MKQTTAIIPAILLFLLFFSCNMGTNNVSTNSRDTAYYNSIENWKNERLNNLKGKEGWLNLAGLYWLEEGKNTVGSHPDNNISFPSRAPDFMGSFMLFNDKIIFISSENTKVLHEGEAVKKINMETDLSMSPTILNFDSLAWFIIRRENRIGVRLRDFSRPEINELDSIPCFPVDKSWRIEAVLENLEVPEKIAITNVLGMTTLNETPGKLKFMIEENEYELFPLGEKDKLWVIIADSTSGLETYGGGRYLEIDGPNTEGNYIIDFNKAYNPPCAFTEFATCPLPPKENRLELAITAGEKNIAH